MIEVGVLKGGKMHLSSDSRSRYLSLALASRKAIKSLLKYIDAGTFDPQLRSGLRDVVHSIRSVSDTRRLFGRVPTESPFSNYEQQLTIEEVTRGLPGDVTESLSLTLRRAATREERRKQVETAIHFFYALENRALHHYNRQVGARDV